MKWYIGNGIDTCGHSLIVHMFLGREYSTKVHNTTLGILVQLKNKDVDMASVQGGRKETPNFQIQGATFGPHSM